ncbi:uncharacterized protein LOC113234303, partial [Hyposmocoma kahamanoa]|uniref:uncharacterized protein LOC113234303 n=1 Tax=Hyposmocoma kahamanoa TaxID=1477025 RepID=UPI000E6D8C29
AYALLHILSEDLEYKVTLADEAYKLYKNIELTPQDECMLVACSHFLTLKLNETWYEAEIQIRGLVSEDEKILNEFLHFGRGWAIEVHRQQLAVLERVNRKERDQEARLYEFLSRVRLNIALDALRQVRCIARATDREQIAHTLIFEAIHAYHRRSTMSKKLDSQVIRTYSPPLDEQ